MRRLIVSYQYPYSLSMEGPKGTERLAIRANYPETPLSKMLFQNLGLMHMVAPYLPERIVTDFPVEMHFVELIRRMYAWEKRPMPRFSSVVHRKFSSLPKTSDKKVIIDYSGGKDSIWNAWWCENDYGRANVSLAHIAQLNKLSASEEKKAVIRQKGELGFPNVEIVDLKNSSRNRGYSIMRSRNMFIIGLTIPFALERGASRIIIEGFAECASGESFTGTEANIRGFNRLINLLGIPVQVAWRDRKEMDILKDLILKYPEGLGLANSCFSAKYFKGNTRRSWEKHAPTFPLFDTQCGSCFKCRVTNIARIRYDRKLLLTASPKDIRTYIALTDKWLKDNRESFDDMLTESFIATFKRVARQYGVALTSVG
ncbi:MAG: hypothetical protein WAP51_01050 [Candidatus Sungiibacteriota bacterium]